MMSHMSSNAVRRPLLVLTLLMLCLTVPDASAWRSDLDGPEPSRPVPAYRQAEKVAILKVEGVIDLVTLSSLERRVAKARKDGCDAIVLDINTPGGRVDAALDICHLLKTDAGSNTVAWVNPNAYSAGSIISLACREIVVADNTRFGDSAPIVASPLGMQPLPVTERAKAESPLLLEVIDSARRNNYDVNLVQSLISAGIELWMLEHVEDGTRIFVDRAEYEEVFGAAPPQNLPSITPPGTKVTPYVPDREVTDELESNPPRERLTQADAKAWRPLRQVVSSDRLLTMDGETAISYGLAVDTINDEEEFKAFFGASEIVRYDRVWSEALVRFLVSFWVRAILIAIFLIALFIEIAAPGVGAFGAVAAVALLALLGAPYLTGMAQWWEIVLILLGIALIGVEVFVIPGFGVAGIAGVVCLLVGVVGTFISGDLATTTGQHELATGIGSTIAAVFAAFVGMWIVSRQLETIPILNKVVLTAEAGEGTQAMSGHSTTVLQAMGNDPAVSTDVGEEGVAETDLRPAGKARFGNRSIDVKSVGNFIDRGTPVRVVRKDSFVIEVEAVKA